MVSACEQGEAKGPEAGVTERKKKKERRAGDKGCEKVPAPIRPSEVNTFDRSAYYIREHGLQDLTCNDFATFDW